MYFNGIPIFVAETNDPSTLGVWREQQSSLTDMLKSAKGNTQLEVISQNWIKPTWWDNYLLKVDGELVFQREILMKHDAVEYWFARTIIPQKCYNLDPHFFNRLEKESIRNLIFDTKEVQRINIINYPIDKQCVEFYWVKKQLVTIEGTLWVRLAEFSFQESESFYLVEILLPELENVS